MRLELLRDGLVVRVIRVGSDPVSLGRDPSNTLVLTDPDISAHHAMIVPDGPRLRDLRSTNGTFHNEQRIDSEALLADGDRVRLATGCQLRVRADAPLSATEFGLTDLTSGTLHRLDADRTTIGSEPGSAIEIPGGPPVAAQVLVGEGELWIAIEGAEDLRVEIGQTFEAAGHRFEVRALDEAVRARKTLIGSDAPFGAVALYVDLTAAGGPIARLTDARRGAVHGVNAENRATLLYVLGRQRKNDLARGVDPMDAGWVEDDAVIVGVWGKSGAQKTGSNYSVLVHRLRREIEEAGFPSSLLQKRRGALRVVADEIELVEA